MFYNARSIVGIIFATIYFILSLWAFYTLIRHGYQKRCAFSLLTLFGLFRGIGTVLLVVANEKVLNQQFRSLFDLNEFYQIVTVGAVFEFASISLLIGSITILHYRITRNKFILEANQKQFTRKRRSCAFYTFQFVNVCASAFLILGITMIAYNEFGSWLYERSGNEYPGPSSSSGPSTYIHFNSLRNAILEGQFTDNFLNIFALVGICCLTLLALIVFVISIITLRKVGPISHSAKTYSIHIISVCVPIFIVLAWSLYKILFSVLFVPNFWCELFLHYIQEVLAIIILISLPFHLNKHYGGEDDLHGPIIKNVGGPFTMIQDEEQMPITLVNQSYQ